MFRTTVPQPTLFKFFAALFVLVLVTLPTLSSCQVPPYSRSRFRFLLSFINSSSLVSSDANLDFIRNVAFTLESEAGSCSPNICIAFDGSASVSAETFSTQVQIAQIITAILGGLENVRFAAVQYGGIVQLVSRTIERRVSFQMELGASVPERSPITFVAPALQFCSTQFSLSSNMVSDEPNRIVLLGGGMSTFTADEGPFGAAAIAQDFLANGNNKISSLLVGADSATEALIRRVVDGGTLINARNDTSVLAGIADIIEDICS